LSQKPACNFPSPINRLVYEKLRQPQKAVRPTARFLPPKNLANETNPGLKTVLICPVRHDFLTGSQAERPTSPTRPPARRTRLRPAMSDPARCPDLRLTWRSPRNCSLIVEREARFRTPAGRKFESPVRKNLCRSSPIPGPIETPSRPVQRPSGDTQTKTPKSPPPPPQPDLP